MGGKVNLGYEVRQLSNTVTKNLTDEEDEHEMYRGLNVRQPLLKNAGIGTTKTTIRVAKKETQVLGFLPDPGKSSIEVGVGPNCRQNPGGKQSAPPDRQNGRNRSS